MQLAVDVHSIGLYEFFASLIISFRFYSLYLLEQFCVQGAQSGIVVYYEIGLSVSCNLLYYIFFSTCLFLETVFITPLCNEFPVLHVGFGIGLAQLNP